MRHTLIVIFLVMYSGVSQAKLTINIHSLVKPAELLGTIEFVDTRYGLLVTPKLKNLPPGLHGFHVHAHPVCDNGGKSAGGHFDPRKTNTHLGPYYSKGHLGDLPALYVAQDGTATLPSLAPRLREKALIGHSIIIHAGGDNYSDIPLPMGGGKTRIACGVVVLDAKSMS